MQKGGTEMIYKETEIILKNGKKAVLRAPKTEDAAETVEYLNKACGETDFLARYPEENFFTEEAEKKYIEANLNNPDTMMIVCTVDGKMAGNCQIVFMNTLKTGHRAAVMIGLLREFWGLGIGSAMFEQLISAAKERGISQLELEMIEGNLRAEALYRKMGFEEVARMPDAFRFRDGTSHSAVFMRKVL